MHLSWSDRRRGFTLLEVLVTIAITTILLAGLASGIRVFYDTRANAIEQAQALSNARRGVETLVQDVREAAYADDGSYPLARIEPNTIVFYADEDRDASVEQITYRLASTTLQREVVEASGNPPDYTASPDSAIIARDVRNADRGEPVFTYWTAGASSTQATTTTAVRMVTASLIINVTPSRRPNDFTLSSSAMLRNLR